MNSLLKKAYAVWKDAKSLSSAPYAYVIESVHPHLIHTTPVARYLNDLDYVSSHVFHPSQVSQHQRVSLTEFPHVTLEVMLLRHSKSTPSMLHIVRVVSDYLRLFQRVLPEKAFKEPLHLGLAFSPMLKQLPKKTGVPIEPEHVNGGVTWKQHNLVFVYRQEEWEKVLLHELLHFYDFDYHQQSMPSASISSKISRALVQENKIQTRKGYTGVALNEAYVETLATLLYAAYHVLVSSPSPSSFGMFQKRWREAMAIAQHHFHIQIIKLITHFGGGPWKENTHVFAYYVCKAALLFDLQALLKWSDQHQASIGARIQNNPMHADAYARFLETRLHASGFAKSLCKLAKTMSIKNLRETSLIMLSFQRDPPKIT